MARLLSLLFLLPPAAAAYSVGDNAQQASSRQPISPSRRQLIQKAFVATAAASSVSFASPSETLAAVYVDPDRYGDKELKSATVNRLRQTIRDALLSDPKLAPCLLKIAIYDALTYNASTNEDRYRSTNAPTIYNIRLRPAETKNPLHSSQIIASNPSQNNFPTLRQCLLSKTIVSESVSAT